MLGTVAAAWLQLRGWRLTRPPPNLPKYVLISQHTSNWDGWFFLLFALKAGIKPSWIGKDSLFRGPLGPIARWLGGIPVDRSAKQDLVAQLVAEFGRRDRLILAMAPEGTRSRAEHWKSGFYHLAREAGVPIVLGRLDYARKEGAFGPALHPSGDVRADMDQVRAFYADMTPCKPQNAGPIRLREETEPSLTAAPR